MTSIAPPHQQPQLIFRINDNGQGPDLVKQVFLEKGWLEFQEETQEDYDWNLWWKTSRFRQSEYDQILPWQRLNHYPKTTMITRKDSLARSMKRMKGVYGASVFNFSPVAYNLPNDYTRFVADCSKHKQNESDKAMYWICKPADMSRGRGIFIFRDLNDLQYDCSAVVQKYIINPLLISGYKFDLRLYVTVTSFCPLTIYTYQEGLVRFSTEKFDLNALHNVFSHLTNTSINKHSPSYTTEKERVGPGCKWTLTQLRQYLHQMNIDDRALWARVQNIIVLTLLAQSAQVPKISNCFELYGFDILVDENMKPWLLEVNFSPALGADCQTDIIVKKPMLHDLIEMLNFGESDVERGGHDFKQRQINRAYGCVVTSRNGKRRPISSRQRKKPPSSKLPNISPNNSLNCGNLSRENTSASNGKESDNEVTVPMVQAGCGLPSVQHPISPIRRPGSGSDRSCSSRCSNHGDGKVSADVKSRPMPKPSEQSPRIPRKIKVQLQGQQVENSTDSLRSSDSKSSLKSVDIKVNNLHTITEGKVTTNKDCNGNDITHNSLEIESQYLHSISDEIIEKQQQTVEQRKELSSDQRKRLQSRESQSLRKSSTSSMSIDRRSSSFVSNTSNSSTSCAGDDESEQSSARFPSPPKQNRTLRMARARAIRQRVLDPTKKGFVDTKQYGGYGSQNNHHRNLDISAMSVRQIGTSDAYHKASSRLPPKSVGDFFCVFPFNEASRKACIPSLDIRSSVREAQLHLKQKLSNIQGAKKNIKTRVIINAKGPHQIPPQVPILWGPIRATAVEA